MAPIAAAPCGEPPWPGSPASCRTPAPSGGAIAG